MERTKVAVYNQFPCNEPLTNYTSDHPGWNPNPFMESIASWEGPTGWNSYAAHIAKIKLFVEKHHFPEKRITASTLNASLSGPIRYAW